MIIHFSAMKNHLVKTLSGLGLRRSDEALDRLPSLTLALRGGEIPEDLRQKASGFLDRSQERAFIPHPKLELLLGSFTSHHGGTRRIHDAATLELIGYAISYFWLELDHQPDHGPEGLADDWAVINRVSSPLKRELDDYRLWSLRRVIQEEWMRDQFRIAGRITKGQQQELTRASKF